MKCRAIRAHFLRTSAEKYWVSDVSSKEGAKESRYPASSGVPSE